MGNPHPYPKVTSCDLQTHTSVTAASAGRKGRRWRRVQARVYNEETNCHLCGLPVDQTLPTRTPWSRSVHHLIPPDIRPDLAETRSNLRLAHYGCNSRHGRGEYETRPGRTPTQPQPRLVIALFGPPAAGKTTIAHQTGLTVYDRDDPLCQNETHFQHAITQLAHNPTAQAIVIRTAPTTPTRQQLIHQIAATHAYLLTTDRHTCHRQATQRNPHDRAVHAAIDTWFNQYDHHDRIPAWTGTWDTPIHPPTPNIGGTPQGDTYTGSRNW